MSCSEGVKNRSAEDGKVFLFSFFSGVVHLLKQGSDMIYDAWEKYYCIKIQEYAVNVQFFSIPTISASEFLMSQMNNK